MLVNRHKYAGLKLVFLNKDLNSKDNTSKISIMSTLIKDIFGMTHCVVMVTLSPFFWNDPSPNNTLIRGYPFLTQE